MSPAHHRLLFRQAPGRPLLPPLASPSVPLRTLSSYYYRLLSATQPARPHMLRRLQQGLHKPAAADAAEFKDLSNRAGRVENGCYISGDAKGRSRFRRGLMWGFANGVVAALVVQKWMGSGKGESPRIGAGVRV